MYGSKDDADAAIHRKLDALDQKLTRIKNEIDGFWIAIGAFGAIYLAAIVLKSLFG